MTLKTQRITKQDRIWADTEKTLQVEAHRGYGTGLVNVIPLPVYPAYRQVYLSVDRQAAGKRQSGNSKKGNCPLDRLGVI